MRYQFCELETEFISLEQPQPNTIYPEESLQDTELILLAGGVGTRFGDPVGKQFIQLAGRPVLAWSLLAFDQVKRIKNICIVCAADKVPYIHREILSKLKLSKPVSFADCGPERQDSVYSGLMSRQNELIRKARYVAIHDAARPLIQSGSLSCCLDQLDAHKELDGIILAHPASDTLKIIEPSTQKSFSYQAHQDLCSYTLAFQSLQAQGKKAVFQSRFFSYPQYSQDDREQVIPHTLKEIVSTPNRANYYCAETPQIFSAKKFLYAAQQAKRDGFLATDDASLLERYGGKVACLNLGKPNLKITYPEDFTVAEAILSQRGGTHGRT